VDATVSAEEIQRSIGISRVGETGIETLTSSENADGYALLDTTCGALIAAFALAAILISPWKADGTAETETATGTNEVRTSLSE
jgi:hypothetical protein